MSESILIPDNKNIYIGGHNTHILDVRGNKQARVLKDLSQRTVGELILSGDVCFLNSFSTSIADDLKNQKLLDISIKSEDGKDTIFAYTNNLLAILNIDGFGVEIHPSFGNKYSHYFLLHMLSKVCSLSFTNLNANSSKLNSLDILPFLFPKFLNSAVRKGLFKKYITYKYNDNKVKGPIDIARHIKFNIPFNGKIAYSAREYTVDNYVIQLIRHTIEYMNERKLWCFQDNETKASIRTIINATPSYLHEKRNEIINKNVANKASHPFYNEFENLQRLCLAILNHKKASVSSHGKNKINGIIIDASWLWEEYIAKVLQDQLRHCTNKNSDFSLFENFSQKIIPDFISNQYNDTGIDNKTIIGDAKYMHLSERTSLHGEQAYSVYYKTIMYMLRFNAKKGFIFYPNDKNDNNSFDKYKITNTTDTIIMAGLSVIASNDDYEIDFHAYQEVMSKREEDFCHNVESNLN